jgi:hydrogenase maturation factor
MTEIQQLKKTIAEALERLEALEMAQAAKSAPVKWEPKGGDYYVYHAGIVVHSISSEDTRLFGSERETQEQAEHAAEWMRKFNRLMCWFEENAPEPYKLGGETEGHKIGVYFDGGSASITFFANVKVVDYLRAKIRDGVVEL